MIFVAGNISSCQAALPSNKANGALAAENEKLKEARNLSEKNIQRAQRERDLAESNARDLEYQKGGPYRKAGGCV